MMVAMPRFAANISLLFSELPFLDRFTAAKAAGFEAVEILFPYDCPARDIQMALGEAGLPLVLINTPPPNWTGGDRGFAAIPGGQERFRYDFKRALRYAGALGAEIVHVMSGVAEGAEAKATLIENLRWATDIAPKQRLTIEPLNGVDMPGYFLSDYDLAAEVLDAVAAPNLALQYDAYHAQMITGDALAVWHGHGGRAGHVQIADAPGRVAPGLGGAVDFEGLFAALEADGYDGFVSAEYHPGEKGTEADLGWMNAG
jgi:2-dehydrotetronate isomerase